MLEGFLIWATVSKMNTFILNKKNFPFAKFNILTNLQYFVIFKPKVLQYLYFTSVLLVLFKNKQNNKLFYKKPIF